VAVSSDPTKSEKYRQQRGLPFDAAELFDFETAILRQETRVDYGEPRY
jgi:uncharacterized DUF497 family protein